MTTDVITAGPDTTVAEALELGVVDLDPLPDEVDETASPERRRTRS